ncbi:MAG: Csd1 family CRISPR-associated [Rhodospirillaceae bacterium]|nr:MAG: Csd1 family CRISPR-associated [Rhodospirillaceae bacterium]TNC97148.1 MAG: Csd1 family CRISPR-associated protein [Stygiobacter sp.]
MILHRLNDYYQRLLAEGTAQPPGFQEKEIHFVVTVDAEGHFVSLRSTRDDNKRGKKFVVPVKIRKSSETAANPLWDNAEYIFGIARPTLTPKQIDKVPLRRLAFIDHINSLPPLAASDPGVVSIKKFLEHGDWSEISEHESWSDLCAGGDISFRLEGDECLVCQRPIVAQTYRNHGDTTRDCPDRWCLITGERSAIARTHTEIKGIRFAHTKGATLVSFNLPAFESHGWKQGDNGPVGNAAAHAYTTGLNHLLAREQARHHHTEGDTTFVFWATGPTPLESSFLSLITGGAFHDEDAGQPPDGQAVHDVFATIRTGLHALRRDDTPFCILGLAPNVSRLAVRFWHQGTVGAIAAVVERHFDDLNVDGLWAKGKAPGLWHLLSAAARGGDVGTLSDTLRGRLAAETVTAILKGTPYPTTLLARTIQRCQAERSVWPLRAALIKASLNRLASPEEKIAVSLDPDNTHMGYRLGRLFAVLEDIQRLSQGKSSSNVTIRDRYFAAAMTAPRSVYPQLMRLKNAHLRKLARDKKGLAVMLEQRLGEILDPLPAEAGLPATLDLDAQGRFILGYHHQANAWRHKDAATDTTDTQDDE